MQGPGQGRRPFPDLSLASGAVYIARPTTIFRAPPPRSRPRPPIDEPIPRARRGDRPGGSVGGPWGLRAALPDVLSGDAAPRALHLGEVAEAEDAVHDVFVRIWRDRGEWPVERSLRGYLLSAVRNRVLDVQRRRGFERRWFQPLEGRAAPGAGGAPPDPTDPASLADPGAVAELEAALRRAVDDLPGALQGGVPPLPDGGAELRRGRRGAGSEPRDGEDADGAGARGAARGGGPLSHAGDDLPSLGRRPPYRPPRFPTYVCLVAPAG